MSQLTWTVGRTVLRCLRWRLPPPLPRRPSLSLDPQIFPTFDRWFEANACGRQDWRVDGKREKENAGLSKIEVWYHGAMAGS